MARRIGVLSPAASALEKLHRALVLLGCGAGRKSAEVSALTAARIRLARIEAVLARLELTNHHRRPALRRHPQNGNDSQWFRAVDHFPPLPLGDNLRADQ
jgi:predicted alpha/beta-hydrolase family hydrolase